MSSRFSILGLLSLAGSLLLAGCDPQPARLKGIESFQSATTPNPPATWKGDPYASGGIAGATGGLSSKTSYGHGAKKSTDQVTDPVLNRPMKGSGEGPGARISTMPGGYGTPNAPANQPMPSSVR
ncbi:MAG: hypothetical protein ACOYON_12120 [Fimbriimonas sp.]